MRVSACANTRLSKHFEISIAMIFECPWIVVLIARRKVKSLLTNVDKLNLSYWNIVGFIYIYIYIYIRTILGYIICAFLTLLQRFYCLHCTFCKDLLHISITGFSFYPKFVHMQFL